ncbi:MAG: TonB-dependent receptor [Terracidiphilus sp.]
MMRHFALGTLREPQVETSGKPGLFLRFAAVSFAALLVVVLMTPLGAWAQMAGYGAIAGTVTDSTGAVVPGATVTANLVSQNTRTVRASTGAGDFNITPLTPGLYTLTVNAKGFENFVQENVTVNALQTVVVDVKLTIGAAQQTVTVTAAPPVLETSDAALGAVMDNQMYSSLPLLMGSTNNADQRRATDFSVLMPGVQNAFQGSSSSNLTSASGAVNGGNPSGGTSEIYIDGINLPEADGIGDPRFTWTAFGMDSIDQFQVQTIGYSAQYAGQGVQNYSIKQGTNNWHGSVYEYTRNTVLDAWQPNSKTPTLTGQQIPAGGACNSTALSASTSWCALGGIKQAEHMNEVGTSFGGPIIRNKLFVFANYGQYRYAAGPKPQAQNMPTLAMMGYTSSGAALGYADFSGYHTSTGYTIYDPATQTTSNCSGSACKRTAFTSNQIPSARLSAASQYIDKFMLPYEAAVNQSAYSNNIVTGYNAGLSNWYQGGRIDYNMNQKNQISLIVAFGRQASTGSNASGAANALGPPFNTAQTYQPQTNIDILKDTWTITPHIVNQFSMSYGRYKSLSHTPDDADAYSTTNTGILNMPSGQAQYFPGISFSGGVDNPTNEAGYDWNNKVNNTYALEDNLQWEHGKHNLTFGGQVIEAQFNYVKNLTYSSPMTFTFSYAQTEGYTSTGSAASSTGSTWASYMLGAVNSSSVSVGVPGLGTRWLDPSFWVQDDYKITPKLTVNAGLRWDLWPAIHESHDLITWLNPTGANTNTGNLGTLAFAGGPAGDGYHTGQHIPSSLWWKNLAPRVGVAYAFAPKTVLRASYGLAFARGDWTSGSQSGSPSTFGLTPTAAAASTPSNQPQFYWDATACSTAAGGTGTYAGDGFSACGWTGSTASPSSVLPSGATLAELGAVETATLKGANSGTVYYWDKYYGGRTPEYENWSVGIERQLTSDMSISVSYVGSEGHFLSVSNAMWQKNNKLPESYAALAGYTLTSSGGSAQTTCSGNTCAYPILGQKATTSYLAMAATDGFAPINGYTSTANYYSSNSVYQYYLSFPQYSAVSDTTSFVGNENWNALEIVVKQRPSHGFNWMASYTFSRSIDDLGTFRVYDNNRLDRSISAASQPQNLTLTAVYQLPVGKGHMFGDNLIYRAIASDWTVSGIGTFRSGLPVLVQASGCGGSSILNQCMPSVVAGQKGRQYSYGKTASGAKVNWDPKSANYIGNVQYVNPAAFTVNIAGSTSTYGTCPDQSCAVGNGPALYAPGKAARVAPLNMWGQFKPNVDMALKRGFPIYHEWRADIDVDMSNVFNHVVYNPPGLSGTTVASNTTVQSGTNASFGTIVSVFSQPRDVQASLRISW